MSTDKDELKDEKVACEDTTEDMALLPSEQQALAPSSYRISGRVVTCPSSDVTAGRR